MKTFHWGSLAASAALVTVMVNVAILMPAPSGVSVARASFPTENDTLPTRGALAQYSAAQEIYALPGGELADMETASGPADGGLTHGALNYDLDAVISGRAGVPRLNLVSFPENLGAIRETAERKAVFFKTVLPLVLQVNEQIAQDRARLWTLRAQQKSGVKLNALDRLWLAVMADRYGTKRGDIATLLRRHDIVPPSLALAQAATESAWGTSRFVREGNAMFGEWTFEADEKGIVPNDRLDGKTHRVRAFESLSDSVASYITNLNKHRAYKEFRAERALMRAKGLPVDGMRLAGMLHRYSERGAAYVAELRSIMSGNDLDLLDTAELSSTGKFEPVI